jgi:hypothetical protein
MDTRELDQVHSKLDRLGEKLDTILAELKAEQREEHGRLVKLESFAGFIRVGTVVLLPIIIKVIYDLIILVKL